MGRTRKRKCEEKEKEYPMESDEEPKEGSDDEFKEESEEEFQDKLDTIGAKGGRKEMCRLTKPQLTELEKLYRHNAYPDKRCIGDIALKINVTELKVNNWFRHQRHKQKNLESLQRSPLSSKTLKKRKQEAEEPEQECKEELEAASVKGGKDKSSAPFRFPNQDVAELEKAYVLNKFPTVTERENLATTLNYTAEKMRRWFENRRLRERNQEGPQISTVSSKTPKKNKLDDKDDKSEKSVTSAIPGGKSAWSSVGNGFKKDQLMELEKTYVTNKYPSVTECKILATTLNCTVKKVQYWFRGRRWKHREQERLKPSTSMSFKATERIHCDDKTEQTNVNSDPEGMTFAVEGGKSVWSGVQLFFTTQQVMELEKVYQTNAYPDRSQREDLATTLQQSLYKVGNWFATRRAKGRKELDLKASTVSSKTPKKKICYEKGVEFDAQSDSEESTTRGEKNRNGLSEIEHRFTTEEITGLEDAYKSNSYPDSSCMKNVALTLKITEAKVMNYFMDRRYRDRKIEKMQKPAYIKGSFNESSSEVEDAENKQGTGLQPAADDKNGDEKGPAVKRKPNFTQAQYKKLVNCKKNYILFTAAVNELAAEAQLTNYEVQRWFRKQLYNELEVSFKRRIGEDKFQKGPSWYTTAQQRKCLKCDITYSNIKTFKAHIRKLHNATPSMQLTGKVLKPKRNGQYFKPTKCQLACNYAKHLICTRKGCKYKTYSQSVMNQHVLDHLMGLHKKTITVKYHKPPNPTRSIPTSKVQNLSGLPPETARKSNFKIFSTEESVDKMKSIKNVIDKLLPRKWKEKWAYSCYVLISEDFDDVYFGTAERGTPNKICQTWREEQGWFVKDRVVDKASGVRPKRFRHFASIMFKSDGNSPYHAMQCAEFVATYKLVLLLLANAVLPEKVSKSYNLQNRRRGFNNCNWPKLKIQLETDLLNGEDPLTVDAPLHLCGYYTDNVDQKTTYSIPFTTGSVPTTMAHHVLKMKTEDKSYVLTIDNVMNQAAPQDDLTILYGSYVMITKDGNNPYYGTTSGGNLYPCQTWQKVKNQPYYNREDLKASPLFYYFGSTVFGSKTDNAIGAVAVAEFDRTMRFAYQMLVYKLTGNKFFEPFNSLSRFSGFIGCDRETVVNALLTCWMNKADPIRMIVPLQICPFYNEHTTSNWYLNCVELENEIGPLGEYEGMKCPVKFIRPFNLLCTGIFPIFSVAKYFGLTETCLHNATIEYNVPYEGQYTKPQPNNVILQCLEEVRKGQKTLKEVLDACHCTMNELRRCHYANKKKQSLDSHEFILDQTDFLAMMTDVRQYKISYNDARRKYMASSADKCRMSAYILQMWNTTPDVLNRQYVQNMMQRRTDILQEMGLSKEEIKEHSYLVNSGAGIGLSTDVVNGH